MRKFEVHYGDEDLPQDSHRVELLGSPRRLVWPNICPNCGAPASEQIRVRKIFRRMSGGTEGEGGWDYFIRSATIPFCAECAARHRRATPPLTPVAFAFSVVRSPVMIAVAGATCVAVMLLPKVIEERGDWRMLAVFGVFVLIALWSLCAAWWSTRFYRVPPLSEIAEACDFSDNLGSLIVGERHIYAIRNAEFASAFAEANRDRIFTEDKRRRVNRLQFIWGLLLLASLAAAAVLLWVKG